MRDDSPVVHSRSYVAKAASGLRSSIVLLATVSSCGDFLTTSSRAQSGHQACVREADREPPVHQSSGWKGCRGLLRCFRRRTPSSEKQGNIRLRKKLLQIRRQGKIEAPKVGVLMLGGEPQDSLAKNAHHGILLGGSALGSFECRCKGSQAEKPFWRTSKSFSTSGRVQDSGLQLRRLLGRARVYGMAPSVCRP